MFAVGPATRVFLCAGATDMRKGYDGLYGLVAGRLEQDPLSGHLFVFCNGSRNRIKVLFWDSTGLWVGANSHAPQCAVRFISEDPVSLPSLLRPRARSLRRRWRET